MLYLIQLLNVIRKYLYQRIDFIFLVFSFVR